MKYAHIVQYVSESLWAIEPSKLRTIVAVLATKAAGEDIDSAEIEAVVAANRRDPTPLTSGVAVLPFWGVVGHRAGTLRESSGGVSTERFGQMFDQAMADPAVTALVLDIDSPGGTVSGTPELAERVYRARGKKPIVAVANSLAASAAYWIGSQADELVAIPSAQVGSIGVITAHLDMSQALAAAGMKVTYITSARNKAEGAQELPLSAEAVAHVQGQVDYYHSQFTRAVARGRGLPVATVRGPDFGEGRVFNAQAALDRGMIDRVATLESVIAELATGKWQRPLRAAATESIGTALTAEMIEETDARLLAGPTAEHFAERQRLADQVMAQVDASMGAMPEATPAIDLDRRRRRLRLVER